MKLKCIGGPNNGEYRETNMRYGDIVAFTKFENLRVVSDFNAIPEVTQTSYARYKIEKLTWRDSGSKPTEWTFLLHENLTIPEILSKLFT